MGREDEIRLIAYEIWEGEGCPIGRDCEHWFRAEVVWEQKNSKGKLEESKLDSKQSIKSAGKVKASKKKKQN